MPIYGSDYENDFNNLSGHSTCVEASTSYEHSSYNKFLQPSFTSKESKLKNILTNEELDIYKNEVEASTIRKRLLNEQTIQDMNERREADLQNIIYRR
ncbi:3322_t:CDS:1, partial [Dentiscutata erythropus]